MSNTLILRELPRETRLPDSSLLDREIRFAKGIDYDAFADDPLDDLKLDETSVLTANTEERLFTQMNLAYYRAATARDRFAADTSDVDASSEATACMQLGDDLRNRLLVVFHKLTVSIAKRFVSPRHSLQELVSEGDAVLLRAITLFDPSRGFRFSTYATHALRRRFGRYVNSAEHQFLVPVDFHAAPPVVDRRRWTLPYEQAMTAGVQWLETALYELSPRERYILRCRFGWGREFEPRTLQEIADELGVSRERIRQLESRAIKKLQDLAEKVDLAPL